MQIERWWQASATKRQVSQWVSRLKPSQPSCRNYRKPTAFAGKRKSGSKKYRRKVVWSVLHFPLSQPVSGQVFDAMNARR